MSFENEKDIIKDITSRENILIDLLNLKGAELKTSGKTTSGRCIFHGGNGNNLHVFYKSDESKYKFKCHTKCGENGDALDVLKLTDGLERNEAIQYINDKYSLGHSLKPDKLSKFKNYIQTKLSTLNSNKCGLCNFENIYVYKNAANIPLMYKVKYRSVDNPSKKEFRTHAIIDAGEYYKKGTSEDFKNLNKVIYNYPRVKEALKNGQTIFFVEGEKDADNLTKLGLVATTIYSKTNKWEQSYTTQLQASKIVLIGDTGEAGKKFKDMVIENVGPIASSFKILHLKGLEELGDNKDVTDWIEAGHTKDELLNQVERTLDIKNQHELQQDKQGIYYIYIKTTVKDGIEYEVSRKKIYITNFIIEKANIYRSIDNDNQKIELFLISNLGKKSTIIADARNLFIDLKTFRKELGIDFTFIGKGDLLPKLQMWILKYFIHNDISNFTITGIREVKGENILVTNNGILRADGSFDTSTKAIDNNIHDINFEGLTPLSKDEAEKLIKHIFSFNTKQITYNVLGLAAAQLLNYFVRESKLDNLPILQNIGESNSGKSKTFGIIRGMLNITSKPLSYSNITEFTILRAFNMTYLPLLIDELKPSKNSLHKLNMLSNHIRNCTEGYKAEKGRKDLSSIEFNYLAGMMISGEELINENAVINRSNISWYSRGNFSDEGAKAIDFLMRDDEGSDMLRRFSLTLYTLILKKYNSDILVQTYKDVKEKYKFELIKDDRIKNTAIYTMIGLLDIVNSFKVLGVNTEAYINMDEAKKLIEYNLLDTVLDADGDNQVSEYEEVLLLIDKLAGINDLSVLLSHGEHYKVESSTVAFDFLDIWDKLNLYSSKYDKNKPIMSKNEFQKHVRKSRYIHLNEDGKAYSLIRFSKTVYAKDGTRAEKSKPVRAYVLKKTELQDLGMSNIVPMKEDEKNNIVNLNKVKEEKYLSWDDIYSN